MSKTKRALSLLLVLCMMLSVMSLSAFAADPPPPPDGAAPGAPGAPADAAPPAEAPAATADPLYCVNATGEFVPFTPEGNEILFTSDIHAGQSSGLTEADFAFSYDLDARFTNVLNFLKDQGTPVSFIAVGGDYEAAMNNALYNEAAGVDYTPVIGKLQEIADEFGADISFIKGNHERLNSDADFYRYVGTPNIGVVAEAKDYSVYAFGVNELGMESGDQNFRDEDIAELDAYLTANADKPVFIYSHYPLHYLDDRRSTAVADKVIEMLNTHENAFFFWGHNHSQGDPEYGVIHPAGGSFERPRSQGGELFKEDDAVVTDHPEILFTYASMGAFMQGNNGASALHVTVNGDEVTLEYLTADTTTNVCSIATGIDSGVFDSAADSTVIETTHSITVRTPKAGTPVTDAKDVICGSIRYTVSDLSWDCEGATFGYGTAYTATLTLTANEGYTFGAEPIVTVNDTDCSVIRESDSVVKVSLAFDPTVKLLEGMIGTESDIVDGGKYVIVIGGSAITSSESDKYLDAVDVIEADSYVVSPITENMVWTASVNADGGIVLSSNGKYLAARSSGGGGGAPPPSYTQVGAGAMPAGDAAGAPAGGAAPAAPGAPADAAPAAPAASSSEFTATYTVPAADFVGGTLAMAVNCGQTRQYYESITADGATVTVDDTKVGGSGSTKHAICTLSAPTGDTVTITVGYAGNDAAEPVVTFGAGAAAAFEAGTSSAGGGAKPAGDKPADAAAPGAPAGGAAPAAPAAPGAPADAAPAAPGAPADAAPAAPGAPADAAAGAPGGGAPGGAGAPPPSSGATGLELVDSLEDATTFTYVDGTLEYTSSGSGTTRKLFFERKKNYFGASSEEDARVGIVFYAVEAGDAQAIIDANPFTDVTPNDWFFDGVMFARGNGFMNGVAPNRFDPEQKANRAMAVTMLWRTEGKPYASGADMADVAGGEWFADAANWAAKDGVFAPEGGQFGPETPISREELATLLYAASGETVTDTSNLQQFPDAAEVSADAVEAMSWAVANGIILGDDGKLDPHGFATRAQVAAIFQRYEALA